MENYLVIPHSRVPLFLALAALFCIVFVFGGLMVIRRGSAGFRRWFRLLLGIAVAEGFVMQIWVGVAVLVFLGLVMLITRRGKKDK